MKVLLMMILMLTGVSLLRGQKILTLKECYDLAIAANALAGENEANNNISSIRDNNISKGWLPRIDANTSFIYNSEVVDIGSAMATPIPGLKSIPHEQYKVTLDINQVIYDGGAIKGARALEKAVLLVNNKQTEVELYKLKGQVNLYYFSLLLLARQKELLNNYHDLLKQRISSMQSALINGVVLKSDIDVLSSEKIKIEQQLVENSIRESTLLKILSDMVGMEIDSTTELIIPAEPSVITNNLSRPELQLFDLRDEQLTAGVKLIESRRMPNAYGFASLGYGNPPGSNFFRDEFAPYYIVGAGIKWNIFDWSKAKNEKQVISLQRGIIENRKKDLTDNLNRLLESKNAEIKSLESLIASDNDLIILRKRITASAGSKYENGIITATEYLNEMNSEQKAIIDHEIHKINLALARIEYLNIGGKDIE